MTTPYPSGGMYGPEAILGTTGTPATSTPVTVCVLNTTTPITLYTDHTLATTAPNPVSTDSFGDLVFFCPPGYYTLDFTVGGVPTTRNVPVFPWPGDFLGAPAARIFRISNQSIPTGTLTAFAASSDSYALGGMTTSASGITVPVAGKYLVCACAIWPTAAYTGATGYVYSNGISGTQDFQLGGFATQANQGSDIVVCAAGDVLNLVVQQNSGSSQNLGINSYLTAIMVRT